MDGHEYGALDTLSGGVQANELDLILLWAGQGSWMSVLSRSRASVERPAFEGSLDVPGSAICASAMRGRGTVHACAWQPWGPGIIWWRKEVICGYDVDRVRVLLVLSLLGHDPPKDQMGEIHAICHARQITADTNVSLAHSVVVGSHFCPTKWPSRHFSKSPAERAP